MSQARKINKILIANRGEIAVRVIKTARKMSITSVAIYSDIDRDAKHVQLADEAYPLGGKTAQESYLDIKKVITIAKESEVDAIHPGYGFLSENAEFSDACKEANIIFIGPRADTIKLMGSKKAAKQFAKEKQIPTIPGEENLPDDSVEIKNIANAVGYPLLVKASAGGGGKGMKLANSENELNAAVESAKREGLSSFGDDTLLIERYFPTARHIEVQVLADQQGNAVHLFDRDCSLQRRHQKVIEEAPAPNLKSKTKEALFACAIKFTKEINYHGAGTLEFLLDENENFYFMEMNTRLQVEHAVTEMITGVDIVKEQILVAQGDELSYQQAEITINGHSLEARLYAEQVKQGFLPASGHIRYLNEPVDNENLRIDSAIQNGDFISPYYDPMISKVISWDISRDTAIKKLVNGLENYHLIGTETNRNFLLSALKSEEFTNFSYSTKFLELQKDRLCDDFVDDENKIRLITSACTLKSALELEQNNAFKASDTSSPWLGLKKWRLNLKPLVKQNIQFNSENYSCLAQVVDQEKMKISYELISIENKKVENSVSRKKDYFCLSTNEGITEISALLERDGPTSKLLISGQLGDHEFVFTPPDLGEKKKSEKNFGNVALAPLNGRVILINKNDGDKVEEGEEVLVLEAMKMEHSVKAMRSGTVKDLNVSVDDIITADQTLFIVENLTEA